MSPLKANKLNYTWNGNFTSSSISSRLWVKIKRNYYRNASVYGGPSLPLSLRHQFHRQVIQASQFQLVSQFTTHGFLKWDKFGVGSSWEMRCCCCYCFCFVISIQWIDTGEHRGEEMGQSVNWRPVHLIWLSVNNVGLISGNFVKGGGWGKKIRQFVVFLLIICHVEETLSKFIQRVGVNDKIIWLVDWNVEG